VKVRLVTISGFRGVRSGKVLLDSHSLLVGMNAVGKSTVCEALDLALGLERLSRHPVINEYDFSEAGYRDKEADTDRPPEIRIEVVLTDLSDEAQRRFAPPPPALVGRGRRFRAPRARRLGRSCRRPLVPAGGVPRPVQHR
jgi:predicted ATP-dependent endonuclease of OLD family